MFRIQNLVCFIQFNIIWFFKIYIFKLDNINNIKEKNDLISKAKFLFIKVFVVLLLLAVIKFKIINFKKQNDIELDEASQILNPEHKQNFRFNSKNNNFWNFTFLKNEMHSYKLYNSFKFPKISIIIMNKDDPQKYRYRIINQIKKIISQYFTNIEIILYFDNKKKVNII